MTADKIREVVARYEKRLTDEQFLPIKVPDQTQVGPFLYGVELQHALWMCDEIQRLLASGEVDRANRWLGFVQGVLWSGGLYSIGEMADHNRTAPLKESAHYGLDQS